MSVETSIYKDVFSICCMFGGVFFQMQVRVITIHYNTISIRVHLSHIAH